MSRPRRATPSLRRRPRAGPRRTHTKKAPRPALETRPAGLGTEGPRAGRVTRHHFIKDRSWEYHGVSTSRDHRQAPTIRPSTTSSHRGLIRFFSIVDRSIVDRSIIDRSIVARSIVDRRGLRQQAPRKQTIHEPLELGEAGGIPVDHKHATGTGNAEQFDGHTDDHGHPPHKVTKRPHRPRSMRGWARDDELCGAEKRAASAPADRVDTSLSAKFNFAIRNIGTVKLR